MHATRVSTLIGDLESRGVEAAVVTKYEDLRYLTGFSGSNGAALLTRQGGVLATDGRYTTQAQREARGLEILTTRSLLTDLLQLAKQQSVSALAIDFASIPYAAMEAVLSQGSELSIALVDLAGAVEQLRSVKDDREIEQLGSACAITVEAWQQVLSEGVCGRTELEIAGRLEHLFRLKGAEDRAFPSIVASGLNSAIPHHQPGSRVVVSGDLLKIDCGAKVNGYHADFTRTVSVGRSSDWQRELHSAVLSAQAEALAQVKAEKNGDDLDRVARDSVHRAGLGEYFTHPLGHGVGLEIHERPILGRQAGILRPRMAITIEPGVYLPGQGGVRIEDTILVTAEGHQNLTNADRGLISV